MKTSLLIEALQRSLRENGDLNVGLWHDEAENDGELAGISTLIDDDEKPIGITLCGPDTLDAFK